MCAHHVLVLSLLLDVPVTRTGVGITLLPPLWTCTAKGPGGAISFECVSSLCSVPVSTPFSVLSFHLFLALSSPLHTTFPLLS